MFVYICDCMPFGVFVVYSVCIIYVYIIYISIYVVSMFVYVCLNVYLLNLW